MDADSITDIDEKFDRRDVADAWRALIDDRLFAPSAVRDLVVESWRRSREFGVTPYGEWTPPMEDPARIAARIEAHRDQLAGADHTCHLLSGSFAASDKVFVVADPEGVVLHVQGNEELVAAADGQHGAPGRDWSGSFARQIENTHHHNGLVTPLRPESEHTHV